MKKIISAAFVIFGLHGAIAQTNDYSNNTNYNGTNPASTRTVTPKHKNANGTNNSNGTNSGTTYTASGGYFDKADHPTYPSNTHTVTGHYDNKSGSYSGDTSSTKKSTRNQNTARKPKTTSNSSKNNSTESIDGVPPGQ